MANAVKHQDNGDGTVTEYYDDGTWVRWDINSGQLVDQGRYDPNDQIGVTHPGGDPTNGSGGHQGSGGGGGGGGGGGDSHSDENETVNPDAMNFAAQMAAQQAQQEYLRARLQFDKYQFNHLSAYQKEQLAFQRAQFKFEKVYKEALLTGTYKGEDTWDKTKDIAGLTGYYDGQATLDREKFQAGTAQNYLQLLASLRGPRNAFQYAKVLSGTPGGLRDIIAAAAGQYRLPGTGGGNANALLEPQSLEGMFQDAQTGQYGGYYADPYMPGNVPVQAPPGGGSHGGPGAPAPAAPAPPAPPAAPAPAPGTPTSGGSQGTGVYPAPESDPVNGGGSWGRYGNDGRGGRGGGGGHGGGRDPRWGGGGEGPNTGGGDEGYRGGQGHGSGRNGNWNGNGWQQPPAQGGELQWPQMPGMSGSWGDALGGVNDLLGSHFSPPGAEAPMNYWNHEPDGQGGFNTYPPGVQAPAGNEQYSTVTPSHPRDSWMPYDPARTYSQANLPRANQWNAENVANMGSYQRDLMLAAYEAQGHDPTAVWDEFQKSLPKYGGPAQGRIAVS